MDKNRISEGTSAFLIKDDFNDLKMLENLLIEQYEFKLIHYKGKLQGVNWIYINMNSKSIFWGIYGVPITSVVGEHAILVEEFKCIFDIYKKYNGKRILEM